MKFRPVVGALAAMALLAWPTVAPAEPDCTNLPSTSDRRVLAATEGEFTSLSAPSSYYPGCDQEGDPITATVEWGDGATTPATIEPVPGDAKRFMINARHVYERPGNHEIVIRERNERTGVSRLDTHYAAQVSAAPPKLKRRRVAARRGRLFRGAVAVCNVAGRRAASELKATIRWGDGTRSKAVITSFKDRFRIVAAHRWHRSGSKDVVVSLRDLVGRSTSTLRYRVRVSG